MINSFSHMKVVQVTGGCRDRKENNDHMKDQDKSTNFVTSFKPIE